MLLANKGSREGILKDFISVVVDGDVLVEVGEIFFSSGGQSV